MAGGLQPHNRVVNTESFPFFKLMNGQDSTREESNGGASISNAIHGLRERLRQERT
jgi:hypothetical protein